MTESMIREWCDVGGDEIAAAKSPAVQAAEVILEQTAEYLPAMQAVADQLYERWTSNLAAR
jgi:hypothetical protein